jgi:SOS-response transcriptional repressor LexA
MCQYLNLELELTLLLPTGLARTFRSRSGHDEKAPTARGIAGAVGLKSSRSGWKLLHTLIDRGFIYRDTAQAGIATYRYVSQRNQGIPFYSQRTETGAFAFSKESSEALGHRSSRSGHRIIKALKDTGFFVQE